MERIKKTMKTIKRWRKLLTFFKGVAKVWGILIAILGPAMSLFLLVTDLLDKEEKPPEKKPLEGIQVDYGIKA